MKISETGLKLIKHYEGLKLIGYLCPAGIPTILYGYTGLINNKLIEIDKTSITENTADNLLIFSCEEIECSIAKLLNVHIKQYQFDALVSFVYSIGINNFKLSTLLKELNKNNFINISKEFLKWDSASVNNKLVPLQGLKKRRMSESILFLYNDLRLY